MATPWAMGVVRQPPAGRPGHGGGSATPNGQNSSIFFSCHEVVELPHKGWLNQVGEPPSSFFFLKKRFLFYFIYIVPRVNFSS
jgi:hypothetical protein